MTTPNILSTGSGSFPLGEDGIIDEEMLRFYADSGILSSFKNSGEIDLNKLNNSQVPTALENFMSNVNLPLDPLFNQSSESYSNAQPMTPGFGLPKTSNANTFGNTGLQFPVLTPTAQSMSTPIPVEHSSAKKRHLENSSAAKVDELSSTTPSSSIPSTPFYGMETPTSSFTPISISKLQQQQTNLLPAQKLISDIIKYQTQQKERLEKLFSTQRQFLLSSQRSMDAYVSLTNDQKSLREQLEEETRALSNVYDSVVLDPPELQKYFWLKQDLEIQSKQLELLTLELNQAANPTSNPPTLASLLIIKQPFPFVINKNKQIPEDQLQVQLLTSSCLPVQSITQVKAALLMDATQKGNNTKLLEGDVQSLDTTTRVAKFPLKFLCGTKKAPAQLKFGMQIQLAGNNTPVTVESPPSHPLVVITHETQWEGSAGTLLKRDAFSSSQKLEISWSKFANTLHHYFLRATRQELSKPKRMLSPYDLNYLFQLTGAQNVITQKDFDSFWEWFGKAIQKIRYQRHICSMWQSGIIYGFISRDDVSAAMKGQDPGTTIIRFSERHSGQFAITYIGAAEKKIKHYLVQPNDTAAAKKTLPDFLMECPQFSHFLILSTDVLGKPSFIRQPKETVLESYFGKKQLASEEADGDGYEPL